MRPHGSKSVLGVAMLVLLAGCQQCVSADSDTLAPPEVSQHNGSLYAACKMRPSTSLPEDLPKVYGQMLFKQDYPQGKLKVLLRFSGFPREGDAEPRALHIHQYGDLSQGCDSTGGHYNPHGVNHPYHPGDFGNFEPQQGKITAAIESEATLFGGMSAIGRAVVLHEKIDDLGQGGDAGSLLHGNAGRRLGCCIIGISSPKLWNMHSKLYNRQLTRN
ncbi:extracellular superoxide dismutase [Cu-Zn]-like isoform X1 [Micropterus dolomieu]|uniref:extracellular superoxide dismutase [Cu-Zn]-like isoform X1 n=2 Tax=Micropterus dolomieu TaxID=147949 RepID=UPI001E8D822D|nr:extracellular superoxide dismutase [Cu-Zn]-like isoform X1 [Micropterus dolomieu]